jgi:hypothetical protein
MIETFLSCMTPGCTATPQNIPPGVARAQFEYRQRNDKKYLYRLDCDVCKKTVTFTYEQILRQVPAAQRPKPLAHDQFWAFILFELESWKNKDLRAYLGDRVLVQRLLVEADKSWYGTVSTDTPYAPSLLIGSHVKGKPRGDLEICLFMMEGSEQKPLPRAPQIPKSSSFGLFLSPRDDESRIQCANIYCGNPSCHHIYSTMTYTKFTELIAKEQLDESSFDEVTLQPSITLECPVCGVRTVIDEGSFDGLFKEQ